MGFSNDEIYPNQPLSDVACEVRFPGEMQIECDRHRFWDQIRDVYPKILVPFARDGQPPALQHYRFRSEDGNGTVSVALNSFAYSEARYRGHTAFIAEFVRLAHMFHETYPKISKPNRIGWRYINLMPFTREDSLVPIARLLKFTMDMPLGMFRSTQSLDLQWTGLLGDAKITFRLANAERKDLVGQEALLLDIDYGLERPNLAWAGVRGYVEQARAAGREIFENMITDEYRNYLRGEKL